LALGIGAQVSAAPRPLACTSENLQLILNRSANTLYRGNPSTIIDYSGTQFGYVFGQMKPKVRGAIFSKAAVQNAWKNAIKVSCGEKAAAITKENFDDADSIQTLERALGLPVVE
jgi:hypothetical protein